MPSHLCCLLNTLPPRELRHPLALPEAIPVRHRCRRQRPCRTSTRAPPPLRGTAVPPALVTSVPPYCCGESPPSSSCPAPPRYCHRALSAGHATTRRLPGTAPVLSPSAMLLPVASLTVGCCATAGALRSVTSFGACTAHRVGGSARPLGHGLGHPQ
jgi:hypothetical protein